MASLRPDVEPIGDAPRDTPDETIAPMPRWVKIFGGVLVALLLVFIAMHLTGGGFRNHAP